MAILTPKRIDPIFWHVKVFVVNVSYSLYKPGFLVLVVVVVAVAVVAVAPDVVDA